MARLAERVDRERAAADVRVDPYRPQSPEFVVTADSNHGYKMIGVGRLVARELLGKLQALLEPFRFSRYAKGKLHPVSKSPFPWS